MKTTHYDHPIDPLRTISVEEFKAFLKVRAVSVKPGGFTWEALEQFLNLADDCRSELVAFVAAKRLAESNPA